MRKKEVRQEEQRSVVDNLMLDYDVVFCNSCQCLERKKSLFFFSRKNNLIETR